MMRTNRFFIQRSFIQFPIAIAVLAGAAAAQHVRGTPGDEGRSRLAQVSQISQNWTVDANAAGAVWRVRGDMPVASEGTEAKGREFIQQYGALFGAAPAMGFDIIESGGFYKNGNARGISIKQIARGFSVDGRGVQLALDEKGNITGARGALSADATAMPAPSLNEADARAFARARLVLQGRDAADVRPGAESVKKIIKFIDGAAHYIYQVTFVFKKDWTPLALEIDGVTGETVAVFENRDSGTGKMPFQGQNFAFKTGSGKGSIYSNVAAALAQKQSLKSLPELGIEDAGTGTPGINGTLFGRFSIVFDAGSNDDFSTKHVFDFDSTDPIEKDLFDQSNIYFWIYQQAAALTKLFGPLPTEYTMPVIVNVPGIENAFFSPGDAGLGFGNGFMLFGDLSQTTGDPMDDYSRDMTVAGHEYFHAVADGIGMQFGNSPVDNPPSAVNEAIADYFSATLFNDSRVGSVIAFFHFGPDLGLSPDSIRDLGAERVFPLDLTIQTGQTGLPEEHEAGLIFGATLWRLRTKLKKAIADDAISHSMAQWPQTTNDVGFATVDQNNAQAAYGAFYNSCLQTILDRIAATKGFPTMIKAFAAMLPNGAIGNEDAGTALPIDATTGGSINYDSEFLFGVKHHAVRLTLKVGQKIDITITGNIQDQTQVGFDIVNSAGNFAFPNPLTILNNNQKASRKGIFTNVAGSYDFVFKNLGANPGRYKLQLKVTK